MAATRPQADENFFQKYWVYDHLPLTILDHILLNVTTHHNRKLVSNDLYIFAFEYNSKQVNVSSGIQFFLAKFLALNLCKVMLNAIKPLPVWNYAHQIQIYIQVFWDLKF